MQSSAYRATPRRTSPSTAGWLAIIVMAFLAGVGIIGALASVGIFTSLLRDLPDVSTLDQVPLQEESIIYDRTGKIELARFGDSKREIVTYDEIPPILLDATTAVEDKTFWENAGFDPVAIISASLDSLRGNSRGASTITQQLVRARLLDEDLVRDPNRTAERKLKEIIQSIRLTADYLGRDRQAGIITAYLNQNYYGNQAYGVKAAVKEYFGIPLEKLTPAQAAIIAGAPEVAVELRPRPQRRDCATSRSRTTARARARPRSWSPTTRPSSSAATTSSTSSPRAIGPRSPRTSTARRLRGRQARPGGPGQPDRRRTGSPRTSSGRSATSSPRSSALPEEETCEALEEGGLSVTTTLDVPMQKIAEKWVRAAAVVPHAKNPLAEAKKLGFKSLPAWMANLKNKNVRNGALVAVDYQTGELVAYVGSANYYSGSTSKKFQPQYDVAGKGYRQPGSAFKPFNYVTGIDSHKMTAGSMFMDSATDFGGGYTPSDADNLERGPVRVRTALQFSLNIPSVKAMQVNTPADVFDRAKDFGMTFQTDKTNAGLALALGVRRSGRSTS